MLSTSPPGESLVGLPNDDAGPRDGVVQSDADRRMQRARTNLDRFPSVVSSRVRPCAGLFSGCWTTAPKTLTHAAINIGTKKR
ncbi:hypothetical protein M0657_009616 [Pyricularia oryzae]|nr:hypothetical protein M0657_009616 [Pyricularia oryzae]KAI7914289.1 hypothetical protein M9X92_009075 [Pyricularia oryzae]